jgi:hypothetical protein
LRHGEIAICCFGDKSALQTRIVNSPGKKNCLRSWFGMTKIAEAMTWNGTTCCFCRVEEPLWFGVDWHGAPLAGPLRATEQVTDSQPVQRLPVCALAGRLQPVCLFNHFVRFAA